MGTGFVSPHTHCRKDGTDPRLMSRSRSLLGIRAHRRTASARRRACCLTAICQTTARPADPIPPFGGAWVRFSWQPKDGWQPVVGVTARFEPAELGSGLCGTVSPREMIAMTVVSVPERIYRKVQRHLLPWWHRTEEAAFLYAVPTAGTAFEYLEWFPVPASGFCVPIRVPPGT